MNRNVWMVILIVTIIALTSITIFRTNLIPRLRNKMSNNTEKQKVTEDLVGEIYGIDVSRHQGIINWEKVRNWKDKELKFVYVKATEGATYTDKTYEVNFEGAKENGFLVGSYHYFRTSSSIEDQFKNFINTIDKSKQDLIPLIDVEEKTNWNNKEFHKNFKDFLNKVEDYFGKKPIIYTVNSFYNVNLSGKYKEYHFLIGRYGSKPPNMRDETNWTIWQFSETGKVEGIPKYVDIDVLNIKYNIQDLMME